MDFKLIYIFLFFTSFLFSDVKLNNDQLEVVKISYNIGKHIVASNGMSFEKALSSIVLTETSAGKYIIGDSFNKDRSRRHLKDNSLGPFQIRISTVRVLSYKIKKFNYLQKKSDIWIMNKLLHDYTFGAIIAGNYLKYNYEKTNFDYFKSISRYNGGNKNYRYYNSVIRSMKIINSLIISKQLS